GGGGGTGGGREPPGVANAEPRRQMGEPVRMGEARSARGPEYEHPEAAAKVRIHIAKQGSGAQYQIGGLERLDAANEGHNQVLRCDPQPLPRTGSRRERDQV